MGGGAIGNLIDRMVRAEDGIATGKVIDFIDFQWWPIFNVADMGVVVGVICFIVYSMFEQPPAAESTEAGPDGPDLDDETDPDALAEDLDRALGGGESVDGPDSGDDVNTPDTAGPELDDEVDHEVDAELRAEVGLEAGLDPAEHGPEPGLGAR
ncbi:MAG: signal peptidase II [Verrucomicrobiota bacterium]